MFYKTRLKRNIQLLQQFNFLSNFTFFTAITLIYFVKITGSYALGISIFSVIQVTRGIFEVPSGVWSDNLGRKKCLLVGALLNLSSVVLYAIGYSYVFLFFGAILQGASMAFFSGNNEALLFESSSATQRKQKYEENLGKLRSSAEFAWMISGFIGSILAHWSFPLIMWLSVIPQILSLLVGFQFTEPKIHREKISNYYLHLKKAVQMFIENKKLRNLSIADIVNFGVGEAAWPLVSAFYNTVVPVWAVGVIISQNFMLSAIGFRASGKIIKRFKALNLIIFDGIYGRIVRIIALAYPTILSPFLMTYSGILFGPVTVATHSLMHKEFSDQQRATMSSLNSLLGSFLFSICALCVGITADKLGTAKTLLILQFITLPILWLYIQALRQRKE
jgi:MFS family permease